MQKFKFGALMPMELRIIKLSILLLSFSTLSAQEGIPYLDFNLSPSGSRVQVSWTVKAGNTCTDVEIWRGRDSMNLKEVFVYTGICGDNDSDKTYFYLDESLAAGIEYYYRIEIVTDRTLIKKVLILPENGFEYYPNPASDYLNVVHHPQSKMERIRILDNSGNEVLIFENPDSREQINLSKLPANTYYLEGDFGQEKIYRKLLINKL